MAKKLYVCEICGKRNNKHQIVCCDCVERDLLALNNKIKLIEEKLKQLGE